MMAPCTKRREQTGRQLNEFLVSLGLLFLLLIPNIAILSSAVSSSFNAASEDVALDLARNAMERSIADPGSVPTKRGYDVSGTTYSQVVRLTPLDGERNGLTLVVVDVEWGHGERSHKIRLERYVRGN
jgi:hypothetical protein